MSSAGRSGTSDTGMNNPLGGRADSNVNGTPPELDVTGTTPQGTDDTLSGLPIDAVEVVEVVEIDGDSDMEMLSEADFSTGPSFQWWWVPAAVVPVVACGAGVWYLTRGKQDFLNAYEALSQRGSDFLDLARDQAKYLPGQTSNLKGKSAAAIGGAGATSAVVADRVSGWWSNAQEAVSSARDTANAQLAKANVKDTSKATAQVAQSKWNDFTDMMGDWGDVAGDTINGWISGLTARQTSGAAKDTAKSATQSAIENAKLVSDQLKMSAAKTAAKGTAVLAAATATGKATKAVSSASDKTTHAVQKTGKSVNNAWKRTRTFTFAMLVTAMVTYLRVWRQRLNERTMRETASGRLEPDVQPTFR